MSIKSKSALTTTNNAAITDQVNKENTSVRVRGLVQDVIDSSLNSIDILTGSVSITNLVVSTINGSTYSPSAVPGWSLTGNSGMVDGVNFIGNTDDKPFTIRVNNFQSLRLDHALSSAYVGYRSGNTASTGAFNSAIGSFTLRLNTTGQSNTAIGYNSLASNTTGNNNTGVGHASLAVNTTGYNVTAVGVNTMTANTTGFDQVAIGVNALSANTTGNQNVAVGSNALSANIVGLYNTGIGYNSLLTATAVNNNTAIGYGSLQANRAHNNTGLGAAALYGTTTGVANVGVGFEALVDNTTGTLNTAIGSNVAPDNTTGQLNTYVGYYTGRGVTTGSKNTIIGANVNGLTSSLSNNIILADGDGNVRLQWNSSGQITTNLNFVPGPTAGNTLTINTDGTTYWGRRNYLYATASDPASTTASTFKMMGLSRSFTPQNSNMVWVNITGVGNSYLNGNPAIAGPLYVSLRYGTGTAPSNGVTASGTQIGTAITLGENLNQMVALTGIQGMTAGTTHWIDVAIHGDSGYVNSINSISFNCFEL